MTTTAFLTVNIEQYVRSFKSACHYAMVLADMLEKSGITIDVPAELSINAEHSTVEIDWNRSQHSTMSVSVYGSGKIGYALLHDGKPTHGVVELFGGVVIPEELAREFVRFCQVPR